MGCFRIFMRSVQGTRFGAWCAFDRFARWCSRKRLVVQRNITTSFAMNEKLAVAVATVDGRWQPSKNFNTQFGAAITQTLFNKFKMHGIPNNAALADLAWLQFKLRLDQHQQMAVALEQTHDCR